MSGQNIEIVKLQVRRGPEAQLPVLDSGEPAITTDTNKFFIGDGTNNHQLANLDDFANVNSQLAQNTTQINQIIQYNVKNYGAVGDGVHDDTTAIQNAINDCQNHYTSQATVFFPDGKYLVNGSLTVTQPIKIKGTVRNSPSSTDYGYYGSIIVCTQDNTNPVFFVGSYDTSVNVRQGITIEDIGFYGQRGTPVKRDCFQLVRIGWELTIRNVFIRYFRGYGMYFYNVYDSVIENCSFIDCWQNDANGLKYSVCLDDNPSGTDFTNAVKFTNCHFESSRWFVDMPNVRDCIFTACKFESSGPTSWTTTAPTIRIGKRCIENIFNGCTFMCPTDFDSFIFGDIAASTIKQLNSIIINGCTFVNGAVTAKSGAAYINTPNTKMQVSNCLFSLMDGSQFSINVTDSTLSNCIFVIDTYNQKFYGVKLNRSILSNSFLYAHEDSLVFDATDVQPIYVGANSVVNHVIFGQPYNSETFPYNQKYMIPNETTYAKIVRSTALDYYDNTALTNLYGSIANPFVLDLKRHNSNTYVFNITGGLTISNIIGGLIGDEIYISNENATAVTINNGSSTYDGTTVKGGATVNAGGFVRLKKMRSQWYVV